MTRHNLKVIDRDWTPKRSGKFYCSPACGGGRFCLFADFERATKMADKLAARMGDGWSPVVWENLGWHYRVENGAATIYAGKSSYSAWIEFGELHNHTIQVIEDAETPEDALGFATQKARTLAAKITSTLNALV